MPEDSLADFDQPVVDIDGIAKRVYVSGSGPAAVVMSEMPGISPHVARFARWVRDAGMTVYMPSLFGRDGAAPDADEGAAVFRRVCVSAEFRAFWSQHDVRLPASGLHRFHHPVVGDLDLVFEAAELRADPGLTLLLATADHGSPTESALHRLAETGEPVEQRS